MSSSIGKQLRGDCLHAMNNTVYAINRPLYIPKPHGPLCSGAVVRCSLSMACCQSLLTHGLPSYCRAPRLNTCSRHSTMTTVVICSICMGQLWAVPRRPVQHSNTVSHAQRRVCQLLDSGRHPAAHAAPARDAN